MLKNMMHHVTKDTLAGEGPVVLFKLDGFVDALREWVDVDGIFDGMEDGVAAGQARLPHSRAAVPLAVGRARRERVGANRCAVRQLRQRAPHLHLNVADPRVSGAAAASGGIRAASAGGGRGGRGGRERQGRDGG